MTYEWLEIELNTPITYVHIYFFVYCSIHLIRKEQSDSWV